MPETIYPSYTLVELKAFAHIRDRAEWDFEKVLHEADRIADNIKSVWLKQRW